MCKEKFQAPGSCRTDQSNHRCLGLHNGWIHAF